ncbi:hypothetical protein [Tomitella gaofuii]|uniref:hypothetical protein n=1 Tax=Tomitella gaofuii TaxID=2760083 RepID=UPI0015FCFB14|nr:hypothetical protein [Tomitella gaofuii]
MALLFVSGRGIGEGVRMPAQDDAREQQMVNLFNLVTPEDRKRADIDAHLELPELDHPLDFELKSTTSKSVSTVRDLGPDHFVKWQDLHWLFAFYDKSATKLLYCSYASPADMAEWIQGRQDYIRPDLVLAERIPGYITADVVGEVLGERDSYTIDDAKSIMKMQWTAERYRAEADLPGGGYSTQRMVGVLQERCRYVIQRGSTLNNPHIPGPYLDRLVRIEKDHAATLRRLVREYLAAEQEATSHGGSLQVRVDPFVTSQANVAATDNATE